MGRKLFFAADNDIDKPKRQNQSQPSGYVFGAHAAEDSIRRKDKRDKKTKRMCREAVQRWLQFTEQYQIEGYKIGPGCPTPDHALIKEFLRWYIHVAEGKKSKSGRVVTSTVLNFAERLFGGFEENMQVTIAPEDRSEIFHWIKRTLTEEEKAIENVKDPDHSFTKKDFLRVVASMWQADQPRFMPGLLKAIITLALQLYLFTGARIGAFIPAHEDRATRGLRYKHIDLVLFPSSTAPWKVEWKVNQVWLKGNRNPDYTVFGIGIRDTKKPQFAAGYILLAIALQHGALFGIETVEDLAQYDLSRGRPIPLRWKDEYLDKPVLRNVTAEGPQDIPLWKEQFCALLRGIVTTAGYSKAITVHKIRKYLGSVVEGKHGSALVSQIYGHKDAGTYPKHYLLHCSSIDTVSAVLGEEDQSGHIEYFQGFESFYEQGFPGELPAEIEAQILQAPELTEIRCRMEQLKVAKVNPEPLAAEKLNYRKTLIRLRLAGLKAYQNRWLRERRDQRILSKGKEEPLTGENDVCTRAQAVVIPELARITSLMTSDGELSFNEMILFVDDLKTHCERDFDVVYLPNESPIQGRCPANGCHQEIARLRKSDRSAHIHDCVRREVASDRHLFESQLRFCYECMQWLESSQWRAHCEFHLQSWATQHCEVILCRNTVIRPGYCPFCLWNIDLAAKDRLHGWLRSDNLRQHVEEQHLNGIERAIAQQRCGCGQSFDSDHDIRYHLHDIHGLNKSIWLHRNPSKKRKRGHKIEAGKLSMEPEKKRWERDQFCRYSPQQENNHQLPGNGPIDIPTIYASSFIEEHPEQINNSARASNTSATNHRAEPLVSDCSEIASKSTILATPGWSEVIDPRILRPPETKDYRKSCRDESEQYNLLECSQRDEATVGGAVCSLSNTQYTQSQEKCLKSPFAATPGVSCVRTLNPSSPPLEGGDPGAGQIATAAAAFTPSSGENGDVQCGNGDNTHATPKSDRGRSRCKPKLPDNEVIGVAAMAPGVNLFDNSVGPLTRAGTRRLRVQLDKSDSLRKELNARQKKKLRELKSQNLTLRKIASHFPDIDRASLRQAWIGMAPSQRCTRSCVKR